ncbi:hypothetical protein PIB30_088043 [Stylosanthes scabra]|uniref:PB1-like domain-containing protein n=1 Tax=Stylosanthes scabra TaxID=79078 RepID=A0ABU6TV01_9FABA|nr:hypothetical protein [Stylosanthes scabra]
MLPVGYPDDMSVPISTVHLYCQAGMGLNNRFRICIYASLGTLSLLLRAESKPLYWCVLIFCCIVILFVSSFEVWWKGLGFLSMGSMDAFVVPVIHHGGRLERGVDGELDYVGEEVTKFDAMDVNFVNKEDLLTLIRDLGYMEYRRLFWYDPTQIHFEDGFACTCG